MCFSRLSVFNTITFSVAVRVCHVFQLALCPVRQRVFAELKGSDVYGIQTRAMSVLKDTVVRHLRFIPYF